MFISHSTIPKTAVLSIMFKIVLFLSLIASHAFAGTAAGYLNYTTVTGYFLQDKLSTDPSNFDYVCAYWAPHMDRRTDIVQTATNFGLINQTYIGQSASGFTEWQKFAAEVSRLKDAAPKGTSYKVLFLGRHAEGYHNAAETFYGTPAWNCYYSLINGNASAYWEDAQLTPVGIASAQKAHNFWKHEMDVQNIPTPEAFYTSPLARCLETAKLTFDGLGLPKFMPVVKEYLREGISLHTCDHRSNKTWIKSTYPSYKIEDDFTEYDGLWNGITAESSTAQDLRSKVVLDSIFGGSSCKSQSTYISITSHSGEIASILRVLGHRTFSLSTGAVIPVLVKVDKIAGTITTTSAATYATSLHCTVPPLSSISSGACVCPSSASPVTDRLVTETPVVSPITTFIPTAAPTKGH
jgi:broad specificity phosphatase PhoE